MFVEIAVHAFHGERTGRCNQRFSSGHICLQPSFCWESYCVQEVVSTVKSNNKKRRKHCVSMKHENKTQVTSHLTYIAILRIISWLAFCCGSFYLRIGITSILRRYVFFVGPHGSQHCITDLTSQERTLQIGHLVHALQLVMEDEGSHRFFYIATVVHPTVKAPEGPCPFF